ncbi:hypothetical protein E4H12_05250 [Candidatus Thorarchaeota archaeon]|nr:MAG: hypothetical protein E4H12_05250 [Candidatus Thorarchaeota archaeon]
MECQRCKSDRVATLNAKCADRCFVELGGIHSEGYAPSGVGVGRGGDYVQLVWCLECGQIQHGFPLPPSELEPDLITDVSERLS